ncbi:response regulator [Geminocystis sp. NIES-3709]|uniref:response regulator n=1 Tax=Geminocystis sp. NIES-3709 TaxID=1617448 RepID=UPI0005FC90E3|nr:response regulator [Geminocystis sp. NIES-3709]BAQ66861.1 response regulator [Geminocystis sp. NIES-3709]
MNEEYPPLEILRKISENRQTGHLQIHTNYVKWNIYLVEGKIQYAQHSLQSLETLKSYLIYLKIPISNIIFSSFTKANSLFFLLLTIKELVEQNHINTTQKNILLQKLTEDAIESFICLPEGLTKWEIDKTLSSMGAPIIFNHNSIKGSGQIIDAMKDRVSQWQKLQPFISSPHQRPSCPNLSLLSTKIQGANLTPSILHKLVSTMKGESLRNISFLLKQDDLKLGQILYPYIKHNIIVLDTPKSPLDKLPSIPSVNSVSSLFVPNSQKKERSFTSSDEKINISPSSLKSTTTSSPSNTDNNISLSVQKPPSNSSKIPKIICIDDSQVMLDTIKDYLGSQNYETLTVANPMQCLPSLFASKPDLILLDLSMPNINGNRLCQILRSSPTFKKIPIIIVSGNTNMLTKEKIEAIGANNFLPKPFTKEELLVIVNKYLL